MLGAADGPCVASMTSLHLRGRMNNLSDGVIPPVQHYERGEAWVHIGNLGLYSPW